MPKRSNIKWRDNDLAELERVIRNFNAKITRVTKRNPSLAPFLPEKVSKSELKKSITTRADFNRELNSLKRFSRKGAEQVKTYPSGETLSNYRVNELRIGNRIRNARRSREAKEFNISVQTGTMGQMSAQNLKPRKVNLNKMTMKDIEKFEEVLERELMSNYRERAAESYKQNYLNAILDFLGEDGQELYDYIQKMDSDKVYKFGVKNPILSIGFTSDPLPTDLIAEQALAEWRSLE